MKNTLTFFVMLAVMIVISSCTSKRSPNEIKATTPDCARAEQQLKMLNGEMVATHERVASGVTSVVPSLAVITILSGSYKTNLAVASGKYEEALDEKINEIKMKCNLENIPLASDNVQDDASESDEIQENE